MTTDILIVYEVRGSRDINRCGRCLPNGDGLCLITDLTVVGLYPHTAFSTQTGGHTLLFHALHGGHQTVRHHLLMVFQLTLIRDREIQPATLVGLQPDNNHIVGQRSNDLSAIAHAIYLITHTSYRIVEIQVPFIAGSVAMVPEFQEQIAHRQETHTMGTFEEILFNQPMRLHLPTVEDQLAHLVEMSLRLRTTVLMGRTRPECLLVQLNLFCVWSTIDHRSQMRVSHWQRFQPVAGRLVVPQPTRLTMGKSDKRQEECKQYKFSHHR